MFIVLIIEWMIISYLEIAPKTSLRKSIVIMLILDIFANALN